MTRRHWSLYLVIAAGLAVTVWRNVLWFENGMAYHANWARFLALLSGAGVFVFAYYARQTRWAAFAAFAFIAFDFAVNEAEVIRTLNAEQLLFVSGDFLGMGPEFVQRLFQLVGLMTGGFPTIASALAGIVLARVVAVPAVAKQKTARRWHTLTEEEGSAIPAMSRREVMERFGVSDGAAGSWQRRLRSKKGKRPWQGK